MVTPDGFLVALGLSAQPRLTAVIGLCVFGLHERLWVSPYGLRPCDTRPRGKKFEPLVATPAAWLLVIVKRRFIRSGSIGSRQLELIG